MTAQSWKVHKFGGSSLADAGRYRAVAAILGATGAERQAAVVSAMRGVTDDLVTLVQMAERRDDGMAALLEQVRDKHLSVAAELTSGEALAEFESAFLRDVDDIDDVLRATWLLRSSSLSVRELVSGFGEIWSAQLLAATLAQQPSAGKVDWFNAARALTVTDGELGRVVHWDTSRALLGEALDADFLGTLVVTGYVARSPDGVQTTLGRNGSDFTASIFASLLDATEIVIWTDVDGVMSADPRFVHETTIIDELSFNEAMELAYFGAKVLHPQTMAPAIERNIPIYIRNTFAPEKPGTRIAMTSENTTAVKGITTIDDMALINLEGAGMIGVPGTANRLFGALRDAGVSVVMISQGSSEHSICFAVRQGETGRVEGIIRRAFAMELEQGQIQDIEVTDNCSILAVVGDGMAGLPGIAAKVFGGLGKAGVNVRAIAQGSSERNISAVIDADDAVRALRAVHACFYLSPQTVSIGLIGPGTVGSVLLDQLAGEIARLRNDCNLDLRVRAIATSQSMVSGDGPIDLAAWRDTLGAEGVPVDLDAFADHVQAEHLPHAVIVDCSASQTVADRYVDWLARGIHVITPNKKASTAGLDYYRELREGRRRGDAHYLYETTVGAGLPVIQTVRDLRETGDRISSIQGIFSGTLAYLFNVYDGERPFSEIVRHAKDEGYTEPDPRDDLSGMDVARKLVILGREMGLDLELDDVAVESLVPDSLRDGSVDDYLDRLHEQDDIMAARLEEARQAGEVLRYVGRLSATEGATVRLERLPATHAFAGINLTDNIVQFKTARYCDNPLIVQGPGAGPEVTAGGIFADLLRLGSYLGAKL